jgi:hypothetical protein
MLPVGTQVRVTQSLEGSYTVTTDRGYLVLIANKDTNAIGMDATASYAEKLSATEGSADLEKWVWDQLKPCFDPEIPVNIVDFRLVYHCEVTPPKAITKLMLIHVDGTRLRHGRGATSRYGK